MMLKHPHQSYPQRLQQFLHLLDEVRGLGPDGAALWEVMDSVAFEDTQAALQTAVYNRQTPLRAAG